PARGGRPGPGPRPVPYPDSGHADQGHVHPGHGPGHPGHGSPWQGPRPEEPHAAAPRRGGGPAAGRPGAGAGRPRKGKGSAENPGAGKAAKGPRGPKGPKSTKRRGGGRVSGPDGRPADVRRLVTQGLAELGPKAYFAAAGALAAVVLLGFGALAVAGGAGGADARGAALPPVGDAAETGLSPTSYSSSPSSDAYAGIETRQADATPLTLEEAFPKDARSVPVPGTEVELELAEKKLDGDCAAAVWGASVAADLRRGGCSQAVRGLYADADGGYGMAVAVFNLASAADADRFVATLGEVRGGGFVRPLPAEGPAAEFGSGFGMARGLAQGHFAVVSWAARLDGKGDASDETLLSMLIEGGKAPGVLSRAAAASD
ncbi:hypothetical protein, partial [Actinomadura sediminis]